MDNIIINEKNSTKSVSPAKAYAEEIVMSEPTEYQQQNKDADFLSYASGDDEPISAQKFVQIPSKNTNGETIITELQFHVKPTPKSSDLLDITINKTNDFMQLPNEPRKKHKFNPDRGKCQLGLVDGSTLFNKTSDIPSKRFIFKKRQRFRIFPDELKE